MELKGLYTKIVLTPKLEESIQWNWKTKAAGSASGGNMCLESIQWNWKNTYNSSGLLITYPPLRIHSMELKECFSKRRAVVWYQYESIQWNWKQHIIRNGWNKHIMG